MKELFKKESDNKTFKELSKQENKYQRLKELFKNEKEYHRLKGVFKDEVNNSLTIELFKNEKMYGILKKFFKILNEQQNIKTPIVEANCAHFAGGVSDLNMSRSELFGHVKGAYTGAVKNKKGLVEEADGGLLILEELGELPLEIQAMLLTFIETGAYRRVGGNKTEKASVKIIGATNRESSLRDDFRYRFFPFYVPALRERRSDLLYYLYEKYPDLVKNLTKSEVLILLSYNWPGNIREVERIAKLLMRKKWLDENVESKSSFSSDYVDSYRLFYLDKRDTSLNPEITDRIKSELPKEADLDLLESLLNKGRVGLSDKKDDYAFEELQNKQSDYFSFFDQHTLKICNDFEPFEEAYRGYLGFCGLFLKNPSEDENILTDLKNCDIDNFSLDYLDYPKSKEKQVYNLAKAIMKYLKDIHIEDYKWPTNIYEFWCALEDISERYYGTKSSSKKRKGEEGLEKIWSMSEKELLKLYYNGLLKNTGGSVKFAAKMTGLKTTTFWERLKKLGIKKKRKAHDK